MADPLPIKAVLAEVIAALCDPGMAVLQAPPGAGKTTGVPLALLDAGGIQGKILMLEPRRVAARAAAARLAQQLGETPGGAVGYRMRGAAVPGRKIEVVTDGILVRMLQSNPELPGVGCVIFDEFHERALQADLGLALCLEVRGALRPDLALLVMSATLDAGPVAALMGDVPVITAEGQAFEVETRWLDRPLGPGFGRGPKFLGAMADLVTRAAAEVPGDILVFLPGAGEIAQVMSRLTDANLGGPEGLRAHILPLHGRLPFKAQQAALAPAAQGLRHVVLATAIAETSLTLPGVRVVVDAGRSRRARHDPARGMSRLVTERVSRAEAAQRRGRAGRVAPGVCHRMWSKGEEGALGAFAPAEIEVADLVPLALELAVWGAAEPNGLAFVTPPNAGGFAAARDLLARLGALDPSGRLTDLGREMARLPVHPRLARMLLAAGPAAATLAAVIEGGPPPLRGPARADLTLALRALEGQGGDLDRAAASAVRDVAKRLRKLAPRGTPGMSPGLMAAQAFPDRIALRRPGSAPRYVLSGGAGAILADEDPMANARLLVAVDLDGARREARIRAALPLTEAEVRDAFPDKIETQRLCHWSARHRRVEAVIEERFGALVLASRRWTNAPPDALVPALLDGVRDLGVIALNWTAAARALCARAAWVRQAGGDVVDLSEEALLAALDDWLAPFLPGITRFEDLRAMDLMPALKAHLGPQGERLLNTQAPERFTAPTGTRVRIDYAGAAPAIEIRLQEMFGLTAHPRVAGLPLQLTLLSPGGKPVQTTSDLPGFWRSSYSDVRKDMRGRYPRHPWPEDPSAAAPTRRAKPRGT